MKTSKRHALLALCALLLTACAAQPAPETRAAAPAAPDAQTVAPAPASAPPPASAPSPAAAPSPTAPADAGGAPVMDLTQESVVKKASYEGKEPFTEFLAAAEPTFLIPGLNQAMIPQGMSLSGDGSTVYLSGYFSAARSSAVVAIDRASGALRAQYELCAPDGGLFLSHVGGLAVTDADLYVSAKLDADGQYQIARIPLAALAGEGAQRVKVEELITVPVSPSFLSFCQDILWLGNFYHPLAEYEAPASVTLAPSLDGEDCGCFILGYDMRAGRGAVDFSAPDCVLCAPDRIQGMALCPDGTVLLSQSYGRKNDSALLRYRFAPGDATDATLELNGRSIPCCVLDSARFLASVTAMPMTEALAAEADGGVLVLFESGAMKYSDGKYRTDRVWRLTP